MNRIQLQKKGRKTARYIRSFWFAVTLNSSALLLSIQCNLCNTIKVFYSRSSVALGVGVLLFVEELKKLIENNRICAIWAIFWKTHAWYYAVELRGTMYNPRSSFIFAL